MTDEELKECRICGDLKPLSNFLLRKDSGKRRNECGQCRYAQDKPRRETIEYKERKNAEHREWYQRDKEKQISRVKEYQQTHPDQQRNSYLLRNYGLTPEAYQTLLQMHDGCCWSCKQPETVVVKSGKVRNLHIDHDHKCCVGTKSCGKCVRGLLCTKCNIALGYMNEDIDRLKSLIAYIEEVV